MNPLYVDLQVMVMESIVYGLFFALCAIPIVLYLTWKMLH